MADKVFPVTTLRIEELDQIFDTVVNEETPNVRTASLIFPANLTAEAVVYTVRVYANDVATNATCTVTVLANPSPVEYYEVSSAVAEPTELDHNGGSVNVTVNFNME